MSSYTYNEIYIYQQFQNLLLFFNLLICIPISCVSYSYFWDLYNTFQIKDNCSVIRTRWSKKEIGHSIDFHITRLN